MEELLAEILGAIAEFLFEAFLELVAGAILDLASRALLGLFKGVAEAVKGNRVLLSIGYTVLGTLAGMLSPFRPPTPSHSP